MNEIKREKDFFNDYWQKIKVSKISGKLVIPGVENFNGKRILICSCASGKDIVQAANAGCEIYAFDISDTAIIKAKEIADYNNVKASIEVMDFHNLSYKSNFFDIIYGEDILHHIDCSIAGKEIYRCLKPGGIGFFFENSDRNVLLRTLRRLLFGKPGGYQKQKFLFIRRTGTNDEYPLTEYSVSTLSTIFHQNLTRYNKNFYFFQLLSLLIFKSPVTHTFFRKIDQFFGNTFPRIKKYSYTQEILLKK